MNLARMGRPADSVAGYKKRPGTGPGQFEGRKRHAVGRQESPHIATISLLAGFASL